MIFQERLLQQVHELKANNELLLMANLKLSSKLNEAVYKVDYLTLDTERSHKVLCVGNPYGAKNAPNLVESGLWSISVNSQVMEEFLPMTYMVNTSSNTRSISTCHHCGELSHIKPRCRKLY